MAKSKKPGGLSMSRKGSKVTFSWKCGDANYSDGQTVQYNAGAGWKGVGGINGSARSASVDVGNGPKNSISFRVRGNRSKYKKKNKTINPSMSDYTTYTKPISFPSVPTITPTRSESDYNVCTFAWETENSGDDNWAWFNSCEYQSILVRESDETDGAKLTWDSSNEGWRSATGKNASDSVEIEEESEVLADFSCTRWIRVRSVGPRGASAWAYSKWVYALPFQAVLDSVTATRQDAGGYVCTVKWTSKTSPSHPIAQTELQYAFATPGVNMTCPDGASWQKAATTRDTGGQDGASFSIDNSIGEDQCLFVRVNNTHDTKTTYGFAALADTGFLEDPGPTMSIDPDQVTHRATITCTNKSQVPDAFLAIRFLTDADPTGFVVGIIPHGEDSVTVQCPDWSELGRVAFSARAVVGSYTRIPREDGVSSYAVTERMISANTITDGGEVPSAPSNVSISPTSIPGTIRATWDWTWDTANSAEISWADHEDAWESTDEPDSYTISNLHASAWNISGLETGKTWYVRIRLLANSKDSSTPGPWSKIQEIDLSSAPTVPVLVLSESVITAEGSVTASWAYSTTDGTSQASAEIAEVTMNGGEKEYTPLAQVTTAQHVTISAEKEGWTTGETHMLAVRVVSASGRISDGWSEAVGVMVAEPVVSSIVSTSLEQISVTEGEETRTVTALTQMPLMVTVEGAGENGTTSVSIVRSTAYQIQRPDESEHYGFEGELIAVLTQTGEDEITIDRDLLIGNMDDQAKYRIIATVQDSLGQSAEDSVDFEVHWKHQAIIPEAEVSIDPEYQIAILTPIAPEGTQEGDTCDIYRLSIDKPELVVKGAVWGTKYVDPYPTIGERGGHRFVFRSKDGDYITSENNFAWFDTYEEEGDLVESENNIINFGNGLIELAYNIDVDNSWKKDFTETKYLGGSVQGDWNPAVSRTAKVNAVVVSSEDLTVIEAMRRLAVYPGICHVRTKEGSSYAADVQVSDGYKQSEAHKIASFSLEITRVDPEEPEGMTYAEWQELHQEE